MLIKMSTKSVSFAVLTGWCLRFRFFLFCFVFLFLFFLLFLFFCFFFLFANFVFNVRENKTKLGPSLLLSDTLEQWPNTGYVILKQLALRLARRSEIGQQSFIKFWDFFNFRLLKQPHSTIDEFPDWSQNRRKWLISYERKLSIVCNAFYSIFITSVCFVCSILL